MPLGELLNEALELQAGYSPLPRNPLMVRRKVLVEKEIPQQIRTVLASSFPAWQIAGSNGKGNPAEVPWTRYFDPARSPAPTDGWYAVYLFDAPGQSVYLSLNQGTTTWDVDKQDFIYRPRPQLEQRVQWARKVLAAINSGPKQFDDIDLKGRQRLGKVYQYGNVHGIEYKIDALPSEEELNNDLLHIGQLLESLYEIDSNTVFIPGDEPLEIVEVEEAAKTAAGKARRLGKRQGFGLSTPEKLAVERHAVKLATEYFEAGGYSVTDTGAKKSYDLEVIREGALLYVEVKGTTSLGEQIILTREEVKHHNENPNNALVVVHSIGLDRTQSPPVAYGGTVEVTSPWKIDESRLTVISYRYKIPSQTGKPAIEE